MTSRERIRKVLSHGIPDRVPNGLGGSEVAGFHALGYDRFRKILNLSKQAPRINTFMSNAVFEYDVMTAAECDMLLVATPHLCRGPLRGSRVPKLWKEQELWGKTFRVPVFEQFEIQPDGGILWKTANLYCPVGGFFFDSYGTADFFGDFIYPDPDDYNPPDSLSEEFLRDLETLAKTLFEETEYSLSLGETVTDLQFMPGGRMGWMVLLKENPELMKAYLEKAVAASLKQIALLEEAAGKYVDTLLIADDIGDNRGVAIGAQTWREIYKPFYKRLFSGWHERTNMKIDLHCCGSVFEILDDLFECGLDIFNPVQISAQGMKPEALKEKFGALVFFGGGYDSQMMKGCGYEEVYEHVKHNILVLKQGGGYIFSGVHNLPPDMPEDHIRAFLAAWKDSRDY